MIFANGKIREGIYQDNVYIGTADDDKLRKIKKMQQVRKNRSVRPIRKDLTGSGTEDRPSIFESEKQRDGMVESGFLKDLRPRQQPQLEGKLTSPGIEPISPIRSLEVNEF